MVNYAGMIRSTLLMTQVRNAFLAVHIAQFRAKWLVCFDVVQGFKS